MIDIPGRDGGLVDVRQDEATLVDEIAAALEAAEFRVFREVQARFEGWRREKKVIGRVDLVAFAPRAWPWRERFSVIAIEAKDRPQTGEKLTNIMQTTSCMDALELWLRENGQTRHLPRPSIALYVDRDTWTPRDIHDAPGPREQVMAEAERLLWRSGCGVLRRCTYRGPFFVAHQHDLPQTVVRLGERSGK